MNRSHRRVISLTCAFLVSISILVNGMTGNAQGTTTGAVVSSSRNTMTIRSGTGQSHLFVFARNVRKPNTPLWELKSENFEREDGGQSIDFGDFHGDTALNLLGGVRR
jgi:hypothetical protein